MRAAATVFPAVFLFAACTSTPSPTASATAVAVTVAPVTPVARRSGGVLPSADELCALLAPSDWTTAGLQGADPAQADSDGPGTAYCDYTTASGAQGGLELDAFVGESTRDAQDTFETIKGEMAGGEAATLPGADAVLINKDVDGTYGAIVVRNGRFNYTISLPASAEAQSQLTTLATIVLARGQAYR